MTRQLYLVPFFPGDGTEVMLSTAYAAPYPCDRLGRCAFCHADPTAETSPETSLIAQYFKRNTWAETCPCCDGRPT